MALALQNKLIFASVLVMCLWASRAWSRSPQEGNMAQMHETWLAQHGRVYKDSEEKAIRFKIFNDNVLFIESFNKAANKPYKLGINQFADLTADEFGATRNGFKTFSRKSSSGRKKFFRYENVTGVPSSVDWRKQGVVTPIKGQGQCGKELVDCDTSVNQGCTGGQMDDAFKFIIKNNGITTETDYPYQAADGICDTKKLANHASEITGYITAVGYGAAEDGTKYWLVKSSWGSNWGEEGYIRMERDTDAKEGICGIAMKASYPTAMEEKDH